MRVERFEWDGADAARMASRLRDLQPALGEVSEEVAEIVAAVREGGDAALRELAERFDGRAPASLRVDPEEIERATAGLAPDLAEAMDVATANVRAVAEAQLAGDGDEQRIDLPQGHSVTTGAIPVSAAGIYAPGGRAAYPSSVLMCAIPAAVAGVPRIALATPAGDDGLPPAVVLAAAAKAGVTEVYAVGGAQALAALAFGTETIAPVDVIAGPGNRYVTEAKRQLAGTVGIDSLAGPSELMLVLGETADAEIAGLDLCAQAEHGADGLLVACAVESELLDRLQDVLTELAAARPSVQDAPVALVAAPDTDVAIELANAFAPEHLQLVTDDADLLVARVTTAGCVFCGPAAGTAFGDYAAGSNHVLPTGGAGRFSGPLGPATFMRRTSRVSLPAEAARALAPHVDALARAEGLPVHGESARVRMGG
jgi:histidinol dehydrogenase